MTAKDRKQAFIESEAALNQQEAAAIIGCRARDLSDYMQPSYLVNGRPKYVAKDVIRVRDRMRKRTANMADRNLRMLQGA